MSDKLIIYCNMHNEPENNCTKCATHIKELEILSWGKQPIKKDNVKLLKIKARRNGFNWGYAQKLWEDSFKNK